MYDCYVHHFDSIYVLMNTDVNHHHHDPYYLYTMIIVRASGEGASSSDDNLQKAQFHVTGMTCASCVNKVERHLKKKRGEIYISPSLLCRSTIQARVGEIGFFMVMLVELLGDRYICRF